jgi:hypothetical protein
MNGKDPEQCDPNLHPVILRKQDLGPKVVPEQKPSDIYCPISKFYDAKPAKKK